MKRHEFHHDLSGLPVTDVYSVYKCRHIHHKWSVNGNGPTRARRIRKDSAAYKRLKKLLESNQ